MILSHDVKQRARAQFGQWAATYDAHWLNHFLFEPSHALLLAELERHRPCRLLDIGCGTGELAGRMASRGWSAVGMDLSEPMLHQARAKPSDDGSLAVVTVGDSEHLPFAAASFDIVTCANSFHHYPHQDAVVREMFRILRPGGQLYLLDGWPDVWTGRIMYDLIITNVEGGRVRHRESHELRAMFEAAGFRSVRQKRIYSFFPILLTCGTAPGESRKGQT